MPCVRSCSATSANSSIWNIKRLLSDTSEFLQQMPVFEPLLLCRQERGRRISVLVEVLRKPAFGAGESDEVDGLARLRVGVPVLLDVGIADQAQPLFEALALAR